MKRYFSILCIFCTAHLWAQTRLTLEQCLDMALEHNKSVAIAQEQVSAAAAQKKVARSAYLPKVDASAAYLYTQQTFALLAADKFIPVGKMMDDGTFGFDQAHVNNAFAAGGVPLDADGQPFDPKVNPEKVQWKNYAYLPKDAFKMKMHSTILANVGLTQPLFMGGRIRELNKIAGFAQSIAQQQLTTEQTATLYSTEENYWQVVSLTHKVRIADEYKALMDKLNTNLEALQQEGMATKNDVLKVKVKTNEVNVSLTKAANGLRLSKMALCRLIGLPLDSDIALEETFDSASPQAAADASDEWRNRPELQSLDYLGKIADAKVKIARAGHLPTLGLKAGYMISNPNPYNGFYPEFAGNFTVAVALQIPIFHWGETRQTMNVARSERNIAQLKRDETVEKIELQYTQARLRIKEAAERSESAHQNLEQAQENLRYANMGFEEGMVQVAGVLEAQAAWFSAYSEMIDAQIEAELSEAYLKKVSGTK